MKRYILQRASFAVFSLVAATAQHHSLILVTRNVSDMRHFTDLAIESPWQ